ncbi:UDP-glucuronosyltransferase 2B7-like [Melanaphis sacchari]|uniref:UDP-glucuronosyltransferase 2B7-like n=1 Tax=Melanaphis sacchari TaxID=742174 RepID=UPI000DC13248|nr:UDP-glucuronosyltransferase 2B7-like [Melanaphis sacchari]
MALIQMSTAVSLTLLLWLSVDLRTIPVSEASRILAIETIAGKSHWNFMSSVLRSLVDAGHTVTVFTPFPDGDRENYTEVDTSSDFPMKLNLDAMQAIEDYGDPFTLVKVLSVLTRFYCDVIHGNRKLADLLASSIRDRFDLLLIEPLSFDCFSYIADALGLPVIYVIPSPMITFTERLYTGHLSNPSYVSNTFANYAVPSTFIQRFTNTALLTYGMVRNTYDRLVFRLMDARPYDLVPTVNPSIIFQNSHYVTESPRPVTSNVVYIGGIHLKSAKIIPKDILDFIEDSPHGVIFFTFGSTIKVSSLPEHIENAFKEALANVPQRVLWKYEGEMKDKPKNVMTKKWFPQREILLHPKVKLFISHGGMSGVYEALDGGVPVLGIPLFYDQPRNVEHLVLAGMAISMDFLSTTKEKLTNAISKLINDETYSKNAKIASIRFKDRPMTPQESVVYWTEYVIRHKGAPHLKSHALNLTWYQYLLLDVFVVVLIFVFLVTFLVYKVFKRIRKYTFKNDKVKTK